ncbi:MAG: universal stress protein [Desulfatirhabdiaceae bacterium]
MFHKIVVGTDLSQASDRVIGCLHGLRTLGVVKVILVHALGIRHLDVLKYELAPQAEPKLQEQKRILEDQGFLVTIRIEPGLPAFEINKIAHQTEASLIVVGSHGVTAGP